MELAHAISRQQPPTIETYNAWQYAYSFFNVKLFDSRLPACLITLQRKNRTRGYFSPTRFVRAEGSRTDEIAMNPAFFAVSSPIQVLSTLVHEMVHLQQAHFGKPSRRSYHNREWADMMEAVGLQPTHDGTENGKRTGERMTHLVRKGGRFEAAALELLAAGFQITWMDRDHAQVTSLPPDAPLLRIKGKDGDDDANGAAKPKRKTKSGQRIKYQCPDCQIRAWAKAGVNLLCGECRIDLQPEGEGDEPKHPANNEDEG
jgi:hypothetical protein